MSQPANGTPQSSLPNGYFEEPAAAPNHLTPEQMRAKTEEMRVVNDYRLACIESNVIMESYGAYGWDRAQGFGGSDTTEFYLRMRQQAGGLAIPPAQPGDRRGGAKWPVWRTDVELNRLRQASRVLCASNDYAKGLLRNQTNYTIGKGFQYKAGPKHQLLPHVNDADASQQENEQKRKEHIKRRRGVEKIVEAVQRWIDDFCARNNWNTAASSYEIGEDGSVGSASSTREREAHWRVDRDGEAIIRLFLREDGKVDVRFVGPEMVWGAPNGQSEIDGWSYGIQHLVVIAEDDNGNEIRYPDLERVCAYYIRPHEVSQPIYDKRHDAGGEIVPASEIVHIKDPWEDAEVKRGTPVFAYDTFDAITRATNLQRNVSITSAVQAATAEIWKHTIGTKSQIESLQNGPLARSVNTGDGSTRVEQRIFPGMIRRIPAGQEPVPDPATTRVPEYQSAAQGDLRQAGASQSAPEFLVSGDASNGNFASISEAGVPYVRAAESRQEHFKTAFLRLIWRVISYAVKCRALPEEALTLVDIAVEGMEIAKNNEGELAQSRTQNLAAKVTSPQIECAKLGNDPNQVIADWKEWDKEMSPPQPAGSPPGQPGGQPPAASPGAEQSPPGASGSEKSPFDGLPQEDLSWQMAGADVQEDLDSTGTGEVIDKLGRKTHWVNHRRVKGQKEVDDAKAEAGQAAQASKQASPKTVEATVAGKPVTVVSHDSEHGLVKVKGADGVSVLPIAKVQVGQPDKQGAQEPPPADKAKQEPKSEPATEKPVAKQDAEPTGKAMNKPAAITNDPVTAPPPAKPDVPLYEPDPTVDTTGNGVADASRVGVPADQVPPPPSIGRLPRLTDTERSVEQSFIESFESDPDAMVKDYIDKKNHQVGTDKKGNPIYEIGDAPNIFNTDDCKMLNATYNPPKDAGATPDQVLDNRSQYNTVLHQTANAIAKKAFLKFLDDDMAKLPPEKRTVLVTSGGVAAGKGFALGRVDQVKKVADHAGAVWDAAGEQNATENPWILKECEKRGIKATFLYVHSDPAKTWENPSRGVVERAGKIGRMVDARLFADSYTLGARNFDAFHKANKDKAEFFILDNTDEGKDAKGNPSVLDAVPDAALKADPDELFDRCVSYLQNSNTVKPAVKRGGTNGLRIWPKSAKGDNGANGKEAEQQKPKHGERATGAVAKRAELIAKAKELIAKAKQSRIDAFHSVKRDAESAHDDANKQASKALGGINQIVPGDDGEHQKLYSRLESAIGNYDHGGSITERFGNLKKIKASAEKFMNADHKPVALTEEQKKAKATVSKLDADISKAQTRRDAIAEGLAKAKATGNKDAVQKYIDDSDGEWSELGKKVQANQAEAKRLGATIPDGLDEDDVAQNKKALQAIAVRAGAAMERLKEYVKHRKEMAAIKAGEPMDVQESMQDDGAVSDWAALLESMESPEIVHRGQGWLDFGDDEGWVEIRPGGTDLL